MVNSAVISFNMMYPEQPDIYLANQAITHFSDLLNIYLHPQLFHFLAIPFFRPSGHFLMYELLTPILGWHNTKGLLLVNFIFLGLTGYFLIKLYSLLFPNFKMGGYIAFSFYLMHPALNLSRLIILHFEFAYIFFSLVSLYCFVLFCQKNNFAALISDKYKHSKPHAIGFFLSAIIFYTIAITFKEPAIIVGPLMMLYLCIVCYPKKTALLGYCHQCIANKTFRQICFLLLITSLTLCDQ